MTTRRTILAGGAALAVGTPFAALADEAEQARYAAAADFSESTHGSGFLVMKGRRIVYERYTTPQAAETPMFLASATKSFWGVAAAAAIEDGLLTGFDQKASDILTEWEADPRKSQITLRQILSLTSGLHNDIMAIQGEGTAPDKFAFAVASPLDDDPGTRFTYGPVNFYVFGAILKRRLASRGQDPLAYLKARILDPIGLTYGKWTRDKAGNPHIPNGADVAAREWVKFGRLVLDKGRVGSRQLVRADLLAQCFIPNAANPGYGLTWWLNAKGGISTRQKSPPGAAGGVIYPDGLPDLAGALGAGPNHLLVIPSLDMVVIRQTPAEIRPADRTWAEQQRIAAERQRGFSDANLLSLILTGKPPVLRPLPLTGGRGAPI